MLQRQKNFIAKNDLQVEPRSQSQSTPNPNFMSFLAMVIMLHPVSG